MNNEESNQAQSSFIAPTPLRPFQVWCKCNFPFIEDTFEAMDYYSLLCKVVNYLNEVIKNLNINEGNIEYLNNSFITLKTYVDTYFNNLNLQNEVNNKLDQMATDGTLDQIINDQIFNELNTKVNTNTTNIAANSENIETLQNDTKGLNLLYQNHMIYDTGATGRVQGMTVDDNGRMWVFEQTNNPYGKLNVFDIGKFKKLFEIPNIKFYHGNDLCYLNGKIYCAPIYNENNQYNNKKICIYDINTGTVTEIDPFANLSNVDCMWGITVYDDNTLLCGLMKDGDNLWNKMYLYKLNLTNYTVQAISVRNTNNYRMNFYTFHQCMEYCDGKLYIACNATNTIVEMDISVTSPTSGRLAANVSKFYNVPNFDNLGLNLGEIEGISKIPSGTWGKNTIMFGTEININNAYKYKTYKTYVFNAYSNNPILALPHWYEQFNIANYRTFVNLDNTLKPDTFYEDGSTKYPFKDLGRALQFCKYNKITHVGSIVAKGQNYILGHQTNMKARIYLKSASDSFSIRNTEISLNSCELDFTNNYDNNPVDNYIINFGQNNMAIEDSKVNFFRCKLNGNNKKIIAKNRSTVSFYDSTLDTTFSPALTAEKSSVVYGGIISFPQDNNVFYDINHFSQCFINNPTIVPTSKISRSSTSTVIYPGIINGN